MRVFRVVSVLGNNGLLQQNFLKHINRTCTPVDERMWRNETWQTCFTTQFDKSSCLGIVFYELPCNSEQYVRQLSYEGIPYKRVWPATIKRHMVKTFGPPSPNIFLRERPDWDAFISDHTQSNNEIYV